MNGSVNKSLSYIYPQLPGNGLCYRRVFKSRVRMKTRSKAYENGDVNDTNDPNGVRKRHINNSDLVSSELHITPLVCSLSSVAMIVLFP